MRNCSLESNDEVKRVKRSSSFIEDAIDRFQVILQIYDHQECTPTPDSIAKIHTSFVNSSGVQAIYPAVPDRIHLRDAPPSSTQSSEQICVFKKKTSRPYFEAMLPLDQVLSASQCASLPHNYSESAKSRTSSSICTSSSASNSTLSSSTPPSPVDLDRDLDTEMIRLGASSIQEGDGSEKQRWSLLPQKIQHDDMQANAPNGRMKDSFRNFGRRVLRRRNSQLAIFHTNRHFSPGLELVDGSEHQSCSDLESSSSLSTPALSYCESVQQKTSSITSLIVDTSPALSAPSLLPPQIVITTPSTEYDADGSIKQLRADVDRNSAGSGLGSNTETLAVNDMPDGECPSLEQDHPFCSNDDTPSSSLDANTSCIPAATSPRISAAISPRAPRRSQQVSQEAALLPWTNQSADSDDEYGSDKDVEKSEIPLQPTRSRSKKSRSGGELRSAGLNTASKRAAYACTVLKFHPQLGTYACLQNVDRDLLIPRSINEASRLLQHPTSTSYQRNMRIGLARSIILRRLRTEAFSLLMEKELEWFVARYLRFFIAPEKLASRLAKKAAESSMEALAKPPVKQGKQSGMAQWASRPRYDVRCGLLEDYGADNLVSPSERRARLMPMQLSKRCKALAGLVPVIKEEKNPATIKKPTKKDSAKTFAPIWQRPSSRKGNESKEAIATLTDPERHRNTTVLQRNDKKIACNDEEEEEDMPLLVLMKRQSMQPSSSRSSSTADSTSTEFKAPLLPVDECKRQAERRERPLSIVDDKLRQSYEKRKQQDRIKIYSSTKSSLPNCTPTVSRSISYEVSKESKSSSHLARISTSYPAQHARGKSNSSIPASPAIKTSIKPTSKRRLSALPALGMKSTPSSRPPLVPMPAFHYTYPSVLPTLATQSMPTQIISPYNMQYASSNPSLRYPSSAAYHP